MTLVPFWLLNFKITPLVTNKVMDLFRQGVYVT